MGKACSIQHSENICKNLLLLERLLLLKHDLFRHLFNILPVLLGVLRALRTIYHLEGLLGYYRGKTFRSLLFCYGELLIDNKASFWGQALFMKEVNLISKNKYMYACLKFLSIY